MTQLTEEQFLGPHWESPDAKDYREILEHPEDGGVAFERIYTRQRNRFYQIAYGILGNRLDAEEVTQDVMDRIWRSAHTKKQNGKFRGDSEFSTWCYRIVKNLAKNRYHWNKSRGSQVTDSLDTTLSQQDEGGRHSTLGIIDEGELSPAEKVELGELKNQALAELDKLSALYRQAIDLRNIDELSYEEIADKLGCKLGTVKSRLARAREEMRKKLGL